ncbi:dinitrogenase iron-molybdenum cofactor biosynthesis protein [Desulfovibrio sp. OttesenSCG-928-F20]|nr:dinitrogenase iron-molybdenum cofactor biosynthesis protein [Desulfovibrio sp. OttesenSCG-928-F20]
MSARYALLTLCRDEISPRFDMTAEVLVVCLDAGAAEEARHLVLAHVSSEELCDVITRAGVSTVVCGAIEEDYFHYLRWKRIEVVCDIMGPYDAVLEKLRRGALASGDSLYGEAE